MRTRTVVPVALAIIIAAIGVASCHDPESTVPTSPAAPAFLSVEIVGPTSIGPGQSAQLVANAHTQDGTVKAARNVVWRSQSTSVLQVNSTGVATGGQVRGEALVTASVTMGRVTQTAARSILVLPDGTFRLAGNVTEDGSGGVFVPGVTVETTTGDPTTTTDGSGSYRLYGVPPSADIRVSRPGYVTQIRHVTLSANSTENFVLAIDGTRVSLPGNYTLTLDAGSGCTAFSLAPDLASSLRHRTYDATITQAGSALTAILTESRFRLNSLGLGNRFTGRALGGGAIFDLNFFDAYYYGYYGPTSYPVAELLPDGTYLVSEGELTLNGSASGLSGSLDGELAQWDRNFPHSNSRQVGACAGTINSTLTPR